MPVIHRDQVVPLLAVGMVLWLAGVVLVGWPLRLMGLGPGVNALLYPVLLPALVGLALGRRAGQEGALDAAVAGVLGIVLGSVIRVGFWGAFMLLQRTELGIVALPGALLGLVSVAFMNVSVSRFLVVGAGAFLGARSVAKPSPLRRPDVWRRIARAGLVAPLVLVALASIPATIRGTAELAAVATGNAPPPPPRTRALTEAQLWQALQGVAVEQAVHYTVEGFTYTEDPADLPPVPDGVRLEIHWAGASGWTGVVWDTLRPELVCAVAVGDVPRDRVHAAVDPTQPEYPACRRDEERRP